MESIINQYLSTVRPMHWKFIEPSKKYADIVIPGRGYSGIAVDKIISMIIANLKGSK